ncbi:MULTISPECIES: ABC transporter permease subunit [Rhodomicrobium]|uniref:ABC transporter permease n=1 Tax=Rhodomicrobium TaxID=1068 RepID=UPI001AEC9905|nr:MULTISPECIES: ABC transporter permease subunit [Rhodomicrobium]
MDFYFDAKIWASDTVCAALRPVSPTLFATSCGRFIDGFFVSIELLVIATLIGFPLAIGLALARTSRSSILSALSYSYSYVFRGTPLLVQLWIFYYGFGALGASGLGLLWPLFRDAYSVGLIVLTINTSAYSAEIIRGGIVNVPNGQLEAAVASGMSWWTTMRRIVLPQALRIAWPAYSNEVLLLLKGSALVSTITVLDLMGQTRTIFARSYSLDIFVYAVILYLILSGGLTVLLRWIEMRMRLPGY